MTKYSTTDNEEIREIDREIIERERERGGMVDREIERVSKEKTGRELEGNI